MRDSLAGILALALLCFGSLNGFVPRRLNLQIRIPTDTTLVKFKPYKRVRLNAQNHSDEREANPKALFDVHIVSKQRPGEWGG